VWYLLLWGQSACGPIFSTASSVPKDGNFPQLNLELLFI